MMVSGLIIAGFSHPIHAEPENLDTLKKTLRTYHDSGEYMKELNSVVLKAREALALKITENNANSKRQKLAVVLDIDETVLSNYANMSSRGFGSSLVDIRHDIDKGDATAIKPMLDFYQFAKQNQIALFFVTGRDVNEKQITTSNLHKAGYSDWQQLYLKPLNYKDASAIPYKLASRKAIEKKGYTIVETIGDQASDYKGGHAGSTYKLPNPYYHLP